MLKNDKWIKEQAAQGMISPFVPELIREADGHRCLSYGLSSYGYDLRLSAEDFRVFRHIPGTIVDPKNFNPFNLQKSILQEDAQGQFFVLPAHSYALGVTIEHLQIPDSTTALFIGKSSYARCGCIANLTPGEAGWKGHLTLEFGNSSPADIRLYAGEGIVQALFFEGEPCEVSYEARRGKYQDQGHEVTLAKV
jgi:dCTP deaminase